MMIFSDPGFAYGAALRNIVFLCPYSLQCLVGEGSNLLSCPLKGGREKCGAWRFRELLVSQANFFFSFIKTSLIKIKKEDLIYPTKMDLAQEHRIFLSILFFGIARYYINSGQFPKTPAIMERILKEYIENPSLFEENLREFFQQDSSFFLYLLKEFQDNLLGEKSQMILFLLFYLFQKAIEPIPESPEPDRDNLEEEILRYLKEKRK